MSKVAAKITTNIPAKFVKNTFLVTMTNYFASLLQIDCKDVIVEIRTDVSMIRDGTCSPMLNMTLFHNCDDINQISKHNYAARIAMFLSNEMHIEDDRILVLFLDTRTCT